MKTKFEINLDLLKKYMVKLPPLILPVSKYIMDVFEVNI